MLLRRIAVYCLMLALCSACNTVDPKADTPGYITVEEFVIDNDAGSSDLDIRSDGITDVWLFVDGELQGAYELPATFPVLESGVHEIELYPGIKQNGISNSRRVYPFYQSTVLDNYDFQAFNNDTLPLKTFYHEDPITVAWEEDFEGSGLDLEYHPNSIPIKLIEEGENVFYGDRSGGIVLEGDTTFFEMNSPLLSDLPDRGSPIYLELNYKCNHEFHVGVYMANKTSQQSLVIVNPKDYWNKIYIDLTEIVHVNSAAAQNFNVFIGIRKLDVSFKAEVYIDNIKLIHF